MVTVQAIGERGLIARAIRGVGASPQVVVGPGDDAAVLRGHATGWQLFACDMLVEGVHFRRPAVAAEAIGWKAMACNVSDIAAMGGQPTAAVVSVGLPPRTTVRFADALARGLTRCARRFGVALVGGDSVRAPRVIVDVAILGTVRKSHLTLRRGARAGDAVVVTGRLGGSLRSGRHARFTPRLREAQWLVRHLPISAMMDLSDGLAADAWQLARASRVTVQIESDRVPVSPAGQTLSHALMDGEDFELLFTVPSRAVSRLPRRIGTCPVTRIGTVAGRRAGVELISRTGARRRLAPQGFSHFS